MKRSKLCTTNSFRNLWISNVACEKCLISHFWAKIILSGKPPLRTVLTQIFQTWRQKLSQLGSPLSRRRTPQSLIYLWVSKQQRWRAWSVKTNPTLLRTSTVFQSPSLPTTTPASTSTSSGGNDTPANTLILSRMEYSCRNTCDSSTSLMKLRNWLGWPTVSSSFVKWVRIEFTECMRMPRPPSTLLQSAPTFFISMSTVQRLSRSYLHLSGPQPRGILFTRSTKFSRGCWLMRWTSILNGMLALSSIKSQPQRRPQSKYASTSTNFIKSLTSGSKNPLTIWRDWDLWWQVAKLSSPKTQS